MDPRKINLIFFSATFTTVKIVKEIAKGMGIDEIKEYDITKGAQSNMKIANDEIAIFGVPVYSGRLPRVAAEALSKFSGNGTPAVVVCVYGNRDFDDALLELKNIVIGNNFNVVSAAAFIAQHSIFPLIAVGRPDSDDMRMARDLGKNSLLHLDKNIDTNIKLKGNFPYKAIKSIPLSPKTSKKCNSCGVCVKKCPVQAINAENPSKINKKRCIVCARCIYICPRHAKKFSGLLYYIVSNKFSRKCAKRKVPYIIYR